MRANKFIKIFIVMVAVTMSGCATFDLGLSQNECAIGGATLGAIIGSVIGGNQGKITIPYGNGQFYQQRDQRNIMLGTAAGGGLGYMAGKVLCRPKPRQQSQQQYQNHGGLRNTQSDCPDGRLYQISGTNTYTCRRSGDNVSGFVYR